MGNIVAPAALLLCLALACGGQPRSSVIIATVPAETASPSVRESSSPMATASSEASAASGASIGGKPQESQSAAAVPAGATRIADTAAAPAAPSTGRWIDVDVTRYRVQLMEGSRVLRTIEPIAVGAQIDTGTYESTQTGLFRVYNKISGLQYDPPYATYISDWVGFDAAKANGFHSFLMDRDGVVVDGSTGRVSNGCIRTPDARAIYSFAEIGMPVYVHV